MGHTPNRGGRDTDARLVELVASGEARSRGALARAMGLSASTVSTRVQELIDAGVLRQEGEGQSSGGRRPRLLGLEVDAGRIFAADFGTEHLMVGLLDLRGTLLKRVILPSDIRQGPEASLALLVEQFEQIGEGEPIRCAGVALPGPVDIATGSVNRPSRMPGWQDFPVADWLSDRLGAPVVVDNDANLMALGEHRARMGRVGNSITVKVGSAIGSGVIVEGNLYRGATNAAGDITHTRIAAAEDMPCACGNTGCLETVASGVGIAQQLRERGISASTTEDVIQLAKGGDSVAATLVRAAGVHLGDVLSGIVNFFNPDAVFLTGSLSATDFMLAAVRSQIYQGCYSLATERLRIEPALTGADAGLLGAAHLAIDHIMPSLSGK